MCYFTWKQELVLNILCVIVDTNNLVKRISFWKKRCCINVCSGLVERNKIIYLKEKIQNDPRQIYLQISASTNLQYESLWQEIITSIKQYGKREIKNIMKNTYAYFFTIWNLKSAITHKCGRVILPRTSVYFTISKFILLFP